MQNDNMSIEEAPKENDCSNQATFTQQSSHFRFKKVICAGLLLLLVAGVGVYALRDRHSLLDLVIEPDAPVVYPPYPWTPEREWKTTQTPVAFDFLETKDVLIALCGCYWPQDPDENYEPNKIVQYDFTTGELLSEQVLSFHASHVALSEDEKTALVAGIIPSPDDRFSNRERHDPHKLRMEVIRLADGEIISELEQDLSGVLYVRDLWWTLQIAWLTGENAWVVAIAGDDRKSYYVTLREQESLDEIDERVMPIELGRFQVICSVNNDHPSTIVVGRFYPTEVGNYRWDLWSTDTGEVDVFEFRPIGGYEAQRTQWIPQGVYLSDCEWHEPDDHVAFSPNGNLRARGWYMEAMCCLGPPPKDFRPYTCGLHVEEHDTPPRQLMAGSFPSDSEFVTAMRFSPDSKYLVTGHGSCEIRVWEIPEAIEVPPEP